MTADPRYPIGRFTPPTEYTPAVHAAAIAEIAAAPAHLRDAVRGLSRAALETPYREGGWTVAQVVHHLADSHVNAYIRMKLALTETNPTIKPYDEVAWAELADATDANIETSLRFVEALHARWTSALRHLKLEDFPRPMVHPERGPVTIERNLSLYAWHGRHHIAHIAGLRERQGW